MNESVLHEILILLAAAVVAVAVFRRLHLPPILGYLFVGMVVGPFGMQWIPNTEDTRFLAEFGVVFLLFTIGLEFSLPQLLAMKDRVLGLGGAQVVLTASLTTLAAWALGIPWQAALIVGGIIAMSSTAIVIKQLTEQLEVNSRHGRNAVGVLLFQDLAVIFFLVLVPILAPGGEGNLFTALSLAVVKGALAFAIMLALGRWLLRPLFRQVAVARSAELFMLTVLLVSLTAAWMTHLAGLSLALGAFLAGAMLGETEFRHQVEAHIWAFRDALLGLFFVTIGMLLDLGALATIWPWVALLVAVLIFGKAALIFALSRLFGDEPGVAVRTGTTLAQGGEFGFALLALAMGRELIEHQLGQIVLASIVLSMAAAPLLIRYNGAIAKRLCRGSYLAHREAQEQDIAQLAHSLSGHVVICGYGRVGQNIARFLEHEQFAYVALDLDPYRVQEAHDAGDNVFYGDSTHNEILHAAGLERARAVVITYNDPPATLKIVAQVRELNSELPILVRARDDEHLDTLLELGASEVVPEKLESSLMLASHLLYLLEIPVSTIVRRVRDVRADKYRLLRGVFPGSDDRTGDTAAAPRELLHSVTLPAGAHAVGRSLNDLDLESAGVSVAAVRHDDVREVEPTPELELSEGDCVVLYGAPEHVEHAESVLLKG